jgi:RNA polymerase sigma-70 factor (ECF subfamily)
VKVDPGPREGEWLAQAQDGDSQAFTRLVEVYQTPVYNLCARMLGDPVEAEDAAQETFLRAYRGLNRYDRSRSFATWLLSIASHHCIDQVRRRRVAPLSIEALLPSQEQADPNPNPEETAALSEQRRRIVELSGSLAPRDRAAIVLHYWYDLSYEEIAQTLELSAGAVKSRMHRARAELAKTWLEGSGQPVTVRGRDHEPSAI